MKLTWSVQAVIALALVLAGVGAFATLLVVPVPAANAHQVDLALGNLEGAFATAVAFYLGSSRGSAVKDATLANATQALKARATATQPSTAGSDAADANPGAPAPSA